MFTLQCTTVVSSSCNWKIRDRILHNYLLPVLLWLWGMHKNEMVISGILYVFPFSTYYMERNLDLFSIYFFSDSFSFLAMTCVIIIWYGLQSSLFIVEMKQKKIFFALKCLWVSSLYSVLMKIRKWGPEITMYFLLFGVFLHECKYE